MSDENGKQHLYSTPGAGHLPDGRAALSVLEYLTGCHPPLDLAVIQTVLQELQPSSDMRDAVVAEIRLVWSECRLSDDHRTHERVLEHAKDLAIQAAKALSVPVRLPRAALVAAYKKTRRSCTGGA